eukprot:gene18004-biopygen8983
MPARGGARPRPAPDASAAPRPKAQTLKAAFKAVEVKAMWETAQAMAEGMDSRMPFMSSATVLGPPQRTADWSAAADSGLVRRSGQRIGEPQLSRPRGPPRRNGPVTWTATAGVPGFL